MLQHLAETHEWDIVIIGGGATGLGAAVDAASRGYKILLVEQFDFAKGTSSRSTKLVHGGVRYLAQGNIKLVREALHERGRLLQNAPYLTSKQPFIIPVYSWWEKSIMQLVCSFTTCSPVNFRWVKQKYYPKNKPLPGYPQSTLRVCRAGYYILTGSLMTAG